MVISYIVSALMAFGVNLLLSIVFTWTLGSVPDVITGVILVIITSVVFAVAFVQVHRVPNGKGKREFWKVYEEGRSEYDFASDLKLLAGSERQLLITVSAITVGAHILIGILDGILSPTSPVASVIHLALYPFNSVFTAIDDPAVWQIVVCCAINLVVVCAAYILCLGFHRKKWYSER